MPRQPLNVRRARRLILATLAAGCGDAAAPAPSGPGFATSVRLQVAAPLAPRGPDFTFAAARVTAVPHPGTGAEVANRVVQLGGGANTAAEVELVVPLAQPSGRFVVRVAATDAAAPNDTIFRGADTVTVTRDGGGGGGGEPVEVALGYAGPDVAVASIEVEPRDTVLTPGDSVLLRVAAKRADGTTLPGARIRLSVDDPAATLTTTGYVKLGTAAQGVVVYAGTANGVVGTARLSARPPGAEFAAVAAGWRHSCALDAQGVAYCWGANGSGQLGDGTTQDRTVPTRVSTSVTFTAITAGEAHTCALSAAGPAYCWGAGANGRLGIGGGQTADVRVPTLVDGGRRFFMISAGAAHTCAIGSEGVLFCWGWNGSGRLGIGTSEDQRESPVRVAGQLAFIRISAGGSHTCGLAVGGAAYCWGYNGDGQVGDGTYGNQQGGVADRLVPTAVIGDLTFSDVGAGAYHSCGLTTGGKAYCWGDNNVWQVGAGSPPSDVTAPLAVLGNHTFTAMRVGGGHSCGLEANGSLWCWGVNPDGRIGDGTTEWRLTPSQVAGGGVVFTAFALGDTHSCALDRSNAAYCWGGNGQGQVGDGTRVPRLVPTRVVPPGTVVIDIPPP